MAKRKKSRKNTPWKSLWGGLRVAFTAALRMLPTVAAAGVAVGLFWGVREALYADPQLNIHQVLVDPVTGLANEKRQDLESRLLGKNILKIDLNRIAEELEKKPAIQSARVDRILPSSVNIGISTRTPVAFIKFTPSGRFGLISEDGMILDIAAEKNNSLPLVEAFGLEMKEPRIGLPLKNRGFVEVVRFLKAYWQHPVSGREPLSRISLDAQGNVSITLGPGPEIRLGRHPSSRINVLEKMMYLIEGNDRKQLEYVDLQFDNVIVKRKN